MDIQVTNNYKETQKVGERLAKKLKPPVILALLSNLGGGKTTFTQGLAKGLGIKDVITSPTFVLEKIYNIPKKKYDLHHYDLYRIEPNDILVDEILENAKDNIVVIEWAGKIIEQLPKKNLIKIKFSIIKDDKRQIKIS